MQLHEVSLNTEIHRNFTHTQLNDCIYILYEIKPINITKHNKRVIQERAAEILSNIRAHIGVQY